MKENQVSLTAIMTAYIRAYHAVNDSPKIFDDFLAYDLIPEERRALIEQGLTQTLQPKDKCTTPCSDQKTALVSFMQAMGLPNVLSRARYTEDTLEQAVQQGVGQYVILGAGMDTFAFRRPDLSAQLQVFEVDHPTTQNFKRSRLIELSWEQPKNLHFIPIDFTKESPASALTRSAFDPEVKSFFSWLGVTMYLTPDEVFKTLGSVSCIAPRDSIIIFDYFVLEKASSNMQKMWKDMQQIGEPIKTGFNPSKLSADLSRLGLHLYEDLSPKDIQRRYFQGRADGYHASEHVHLVRAVVQ